jgi:formamidopyrimidine-DNA glycosylase
LTTAPASELEFAQQSLRRWFDGCALLRTETEAGARTFRDCDLGLFRALAGTLAAVDRRGTTLRAHFSCGLRLVAHLGTGKFLQREAGVEVKWSRARLFLDSGKVIHFQDMNLEGRLQVDTSSTVLTVEQLQHELHRSRGPVTAALLGRIESLEVNHVATALFHAKLHPERGTHSLTATEWKALSTALRSPGEATLEGRDACPACHSTLEVFTQAGHTLSACPTCQPKATLGPQEMRIKPRPRRYRG